MDLLRSAAVDLRRVTPVSILGVACLVSAALYLGLRGHGGSQSALEDDAGASMRTGAAAGGSPSERTSLSSRDPDNDPFVASVTSPGAGGSTKPAMQGPIRSPAELPIKVKVREAFDEKRAEIVRECWKPNDGDPDTVKLTLSLVFDRQGKVIGSGIIQREPAPEGLVVCVGRYLPELTLDTEGNNVSVRADVELP